MSDNVKVAVKVRPLSSREAGNGNKSVVDKIPGHPQIILNKTDGKEEAFTFNYVFDAIDSQIKLYEECVKDMLENLFKGYNVTILAYGQTGSGKTFTMGTAYSGGFDDNVGVIPRAAKDIFSKVCAMAQSNEIKVSCSFIELYQEQVYDLLSATTREKSIVEIREDSKGKIIIPNLTETPVETAEETINCLIKGSSGRAVGATQMNKESSRSHAIFTINVEMTNKTDAKMATASKFHLVDLAGSERSKKTNATGDRFKEGVKINQGLLALGNVISALGNANGSNGFVGYRDSKLTRLLQDSLGGNSVTLMIACVSPADFNQEETCSTLKYADRARRIKNKPIVNQDPHAAEINRLKGIISKLRMELINNGITGGLNSSICAPPTPIREKVVSNKQDLEKIVKLQMHLQESLTNNAEARSALHVAESAYEELQKKVSAFTEEFRKLFGSEGDTYEKEEYAEKISALRNIMNGVDEVVEKNNAEFLQQKMSMSAVMSSSSGGSSAEESNEVVQQKCDKFAVRQLEINHDLRKIDCELALKEEHLLKVIGNMTHFSNFNEDDGKVHELESLISNLEKEKAELCDQLKHAVKSNTSAKIAEDRRKRLQSLEADISQMKQKLMQQGKLLKIKEKDSEKINKLNREIQEIKSARVKLVREMKQESDSFRKWKLSKNKELNVMKEKERKRENDIKRMENMHCKKQNVLKRKVEEAIAINRRLKDAIDKQKAAQSQRSKHTSGSKVDQVVSWIAGELDVIMSVVDANYCLVHLSEVKDSVQKRLVELKSQTIGEGEEPSEEITACEEELEMREAQISDLKQKVNTTDIESKVKGICENIQSMPEARAALKQLFLTVTEMRREWAPKDNKIEEIKGMQEMSEEKIQELEREKEVLADEIKQIERKHLEDLVQFEKNCEEKIAVLIRHTEPKANDDTNDEWKRIQSETMEKLEKLREENQQFKDRISHVEELEGFRKKYLEMEKKLDKLRSKDLKKPLVIKKEIEEVEEVNEEDSYDEDESIELGRDPDWKKTPKARTTQRSTSFTKRNSSVHGKTCTCKTGCKTKRCGCRSQNESCGENCSCGVECMNKDVSPKKIKTENESDKENECSMNVISSTTTTFAVKEFVIEEASSLNAPSTPIANLNRRSVCDPGFATPSFPSQFKKKRFYK